MKKVLVTGGSSGLGEAITKMLASDPLNMVFFTYNASFENAGRIKNEYENTFPIKCDFKKEEDVRSLCREIEEISPDILINNAYSGSFINLYFHKTEPLDFLEEFKTNVLSTIKVSQVALKVFRKKKAGKIITILSSALVNTPPIGASIYVANKAYLEELTKIWAVENARFNITSNSVSPSFMFTNFTNNMDERLIEQIKDNHPLKELLSPREVAETVSFLSRAGNHLNGINIVVNAAVSLR